MKLVLVAINSKYVHSSLAPWYLKAALVPLHGLDTQVLELSVNQPVEGMIRQIAAKRPDVIGFSCYIFNIATVHRLIPALKILFPQTRILLGGPEVSYDAPALLLELPEADCVLSGEGETPLRRYMENLLESREEDVPGITRRTPQGISSWPPALAPPMDALPSPFTGEMLAAVRGKIAYYEASRGCPFRCSYCLSHLSPGARVLDLERVRAELIALSNAGVRQIKFVDRTFNCTPARAMDIWRFLLAQRGKSIPAHMNFHFEAAPDLFTDEMLRLLSTAPAGYFQLEIGIQTFRKETLQAIHRSMDIPRCKDTIRTLAGFGNIHVHVDLIAGLPGESLSCFISSFEQAIALRPHCLQLGFLKLLKGSDLRAQADALGYRYDPLPPYEVLSNPWISYTELSRLKQVEWAVDHCYNSGRFAFSLAYAQSAGQGGFAVFAALGEAALRCGWLEQGVSAAACSALMLTVLTAGGLPEQDVREYLKLDWLCSDNTGDLPAHLCRLQDPTIRQRYRDLAGDSFPATLPPPAEEHLRQARRYFHMEAFGPDVVLPGRPENVSVAVFDYRARHPVTGRYAFAWLTDQ